MSAADYYNTSTTTTTTTNNNPKQNTNQSSTKRLLHELNSLSTDPNPYLTYLHPANDNLYTWTAQLKGPPHTPYSSGLFNLVLTIPQNYPLAPPNIKFTTPIIHPNIHLRTGEICLDLLKDRWTPVYTLSSCLSSIRDMLGEGEADSPLNVDVAGLMRNGDFVGWEGLVRFFVRREAQGEGGL